MFNKLNYLQQEITNWFHVHGRTFPWREENRTQYERIIAELLLQRTRAETVALHFSGFIKKFYSWERIAACSVEELEIELRPMGLWKRRTTSLLQLANSILNYDGNFPTTRQEIENLPGIGQYLCNAIFLICFDKPEPLLDVNFMRIIDRYFDLPRKVDFRYDDSIQKLARNIVSYNSPLVMNYALLDYGALVCKKKSPLCDKCVLKSHCSYLKIINESIKKFEVLDCE